MKILLICSKKFYSAVRPAYEKLTQAGHEVFYPNCINNPETEANARNTSLTAHADFKAKMFRHSAEVIASVDAVLVLNFTDGVNNYIGGATFLEMFQAWQLGKLIFVINPISKGDFSDEIMGLSPIVINGDLKKISGRCKALPDSDEVSAIRSMLMHICIPELDYGKLVLDEKDYNAFVKGHEYLAHRCLAIDWLLIKHQGPFVGYHYSQKKYRKGNLISGIYMRTDTECDLNWGPGIYMWSSQQSEASDKMDCFKVTANCEYWECVEDFTDFGDVGALFIPKICANKSIKLELISAGNDDSTTTSIFGQSAQN